MTIKAEPMASGGITPAAPGITVQPIVSTRKNVPMNSVRDLFMGLGPFLRQDIPAERPAPGSASTLAQRKASQLYREVSICVDPGQSSSNCYWAIHATRVYPEVFHGAPMNRLRGFAVLLTLWLVPPLSA